VGKENNLKVLNLGFIFCFLEISGMYETEIFKISKADATLDLNGLNFRFRWDHTSVHGFDFLEAKSTTKEQKAYGFTSLFFFLAFSQPRKW
jgi:hypothetical protein